MAFRQTYFVEPGYLARKCAPQYKLSQTKRVYFNNVIIYINLTGENVQRKYIPSSYPQKIIKRCAYGLEVKSYFIPCGLAAIS